MNASRLVVHLPRWLRWSLLLLLTLLVVGFTIAVFASVNRPGLANWLPPSVSIVQIALTALAYVVLVFFTESSQSLPSLQRQSDRVLTDLVPACLGRITDHQGEAVQVRVGRPSGVVGRAYDLVTTHTRLRLWIGLNVHRVIVAYFCELPDPEDEAASLERLRTVFTPTTDGAKTVGYGNPTYQVAEIDGHRFATLWLTWNLENREDFLTHTPSQLFCAQDIALMTQSFLRTGQREGIALATPFEPMPL